MKKKYKLTEMITLTRRHLLTSSTIKEQEVDIPIIKKEKTYDIFIVPNGNTRDFARGTTNGCEQWGNNLALEEVRKRYRELADENFRRDGGEYDRIWDKCSEEHPEQADEGYSEPEIACDKYLNELTADPDPLNWGRIEWNNDLKWVTICEHKE